MTENDPGYERAIAAVRAKQGIDRGAMAWLAAKLKTTRARLSYWQKEGIPDKMLPKVAKITGLSKEEIQRDVVVAEIPRALFETLAAENPRVRLR